MPLDPELCSYTEIGILLEVIGKSMYMHALCAGATLDSEGRVYIKAELEEEFGEERAEELSQVTIKQLHEMLDIIHETRA